MKTAFKTANTAPTTMLFWEAANKWRSHDDLMPTVALSEENNTTFYSKITNKMIEVFWEFSALCIINCNIVLRGVWCTDSTCKPCMHTFLTCFAVLWTWISLRGSEEMQQDPAGQSGSWLGVLLTTGCNTHTHTRLNTWPCKTWLYYTSYYTVLYSWLRKPPTCLVISQYIHSLFTLLGTHNPAH